MLEAQAFGNYVGGLGIVTGALSTLLLAAAGVHALTAFTVNQRRKEIGIRAALGADPASLLTGILKRAVVLVAAGATAGTLFAAFVEYYLPIEALGGANLPGILPGAVAFMIAIGALSALGPSRRALGVEPREVLND